MGDRLEELEALARQLEPDRSTRDHWHQAVTTYGQSFTDQLDELPAFAPLGDKGKGLLEAPPAEEPDNVENVLQLIRDNVDTPGLNPASGGHLGYIPGGGLYPSALGDYLAAVTNRYAGIFFSSPGAVRMENMLIRWLCEQVGYPSTAGGNLASGGSIANLMAVTAARDAKGLRARDVENAVVYLTQQVHHCVDKAMRIAGLGEMVRRFIPMDERFRMKPDELAETIAADQKKGLKPFMVIASAGSTDTGAIDPLPALGDIASTYDLWFHVDAAYGGFFVLTEEGQTKLQGIDKADSLILDPHKGLFLPYGLGMILVKDQNTLLQSNKFEANYMQDAQMVRDEPSPAEMSPELTKHFRGMRMWLPLKLFGVKPFRAALAEKLTLARYFKKQIEQVPGFEVPLEPELSVVLFRYRPNEGDANAFNQELIQQLQKDGRIFMSSTTIDGLVYIRAAILSVRTHRDTIDLAIRILQEKATLIQKNGTVS